MARRKDERNVAEEVLSRCAGYARQKVYPETEQYWQDEFCDMGVAADCLQVMQHCLLVNKYAEDDWKKWSDSFNSELYWYFLRKRRAELEDFLAELNMNKE